MKTEVRLVFYDQGDCHNNIYELLLDGQSFVLTEDERADLRLQLRPKNTVYEP